jgi:hypothetical protein
MKSSFLVTTLPQASGVVLYNYCPLVTPVTLLIMSFGISVGVRKGISRWASQSG